MSDLISRKAVINEIQLIEKELLKDKEEARNSDDEQMKFAIDNQLNALWRVRLRVNSLITAYDADKVVDKFDDLIPINSKYGVLVNKEDAINLVKGGLEE